MTPAAIIDHPEKSNCYEISNKQFEDNPKTYAFNMLLGCKSYLGLLKNFKLPEGGRIAARCIQLVMTSIWEICVGIPGMSIEFLKIENDLLLQPIRML